MRFLSSIVSATIKPASTPIAVVKDIINVSIGATLTKEAIEHLHPKFKFIDGSTMVDWFVVLDAGGFCSIRSGLVHADGVTKSPFYYDNVVVGSNALNEALEIFTQWWNNIDVNI